MQSSEVQAKHDTVFEFLEVRLDWSGPHFKHLQGKYSGLGEVILKCRVEWRIFGHRRTSPQGVREFVVTHIGNHKGTVYTPKDVLKTALKRVKETEVDPRKSAPCDRPI
jgi:hypothetical protein